MKFKPDKKYNTIAFYCIIVFLICFSLIVIALNFGNIAAGFRKFAKVLSPIIWGVIFAYLLNPVMVWFEKLISKPLCKKKDRKSLAHGLSVTFSAIFMLAVIAALIWIVVPQLTDSLSSFISSSNEYIATINNTFLKVQLWIEKFVEDNPQAWSYAEQALNTVKNNLESLFSSVGTYINNLLSGMKDFVIALKDFLLGFIVMVYLLLSKDTFIAQMKRILYAILPEKACAGTLDVCSRANATFIGFISGKILDSFIIGLLSFIVMTILKMPYVALISVIIGVTNVIPFFGPFIGAIPSAVLVLLAEPKKCIPFIIFVLLLQQFDGNILGPKILGNSTGLPAFWVMFAIIVAGGLFGFAGMLCGVPVFAVIYMLAGELLEKLLKKKKLPVATSAYYYANPHEAVTEIIETEGGVPDNTEKNEEIAEEAAAEESGSAQE